MDAVVPRSILTEFDVVLTGAGISFDPPAKLPSAAELVDEVWGALRKSLGGLVDYNLQKNRVQPQLSNMRMEQFLEVLSSPGAIPAATSSMSTASSAVRRITTTTRDSQHLTRCSSTFAVKRRWNADETASGSAVRFPALGPRSMECFLSW
jgi:hypothetical protein